VSTNVFNVFYVSKEGKILDEENEDDLLDAIEDFIGDFRSLYRIMLDYQY